MFTHKRRSRRMNAKLMAIVAATAMLIVGIVGTSLAWLMVSTNSITNVFTFGDIVITLEETKGSAHDPSNPNERFYSMKPDQTLEKDPIVTVEGDSEDCWLFIKIEEGNNLDNYIEYGVAEGWTLLPGIEDTATELIYYRSVTKSENDQAFSVLADDQVHVLSSLTADDLSGITENNAPTLTFTAYAIQTAESFTTATQAWNAIEAQLNPI